MFPSLPKMIRAAPNNIGQAPAQQPVDHRWMRNQYFPHAGLMNKTGAYCYSCV
jgi:hypothetical protein